MEDVNKNSIDLAVACDVQLAAYRKEDPSFSVDINPQAVSAVLETFKTDTAKLDSLLFMAVHPRALNNKSKQNAGVVTLGNFRKPKTGMPAIVKVAVRPQKLLQTEKDMATDMLAETGVSQDSIEAVMPFIEKASVAQYTAESLQDTAVHELKHASEFGDDKFKRLDSRRRNRELGRRMLTISGINLSAYAIAHELMAHNLVNPIITNLGLLATVLTTNIAVYRRDNKRAHELYLDRPEEVRARAAAKTYASSFKTIITVTN